MLKKADYILIIFLIVFAVSFLFIFDLNGNKNSGQVLVTVNGKEYMAIDIGKHNNETFIIQSAGGNNTMLISDGKVRVTDATCKDKVCVHQGNISKNYEAVVCLPNRVVIEIKNADVNNEIDTILR